MDGNKYFLVFRAQPVKDMESQFIFAKRFSYKSQRINKFLNILHIISDGLVVFGNFA